MQAVILATGDAHKLQPLSWTTPVPMLSIANRPVMGYVIELLARHGVSEIIVTLHHLGGSIERYFGDGRRWGISLHYRLQRQALGPAASLLLARRALRETFVVIPGDILCDFDLTEALDGHRLGRYQATAMLRPGTQATEEGSGADTYSGIYFLEPEILERWPQYAGYGSQEQMISQLYNAGAAVRRVEMTGYYNPLQTWQDYLDAQRYIMTPAASGVTSDAGHSFALRGRPLARGLWVGRKSHIHPQAQLTPPVYIGEGCHVGKGVELGPFTVLGDNVVVDDEATISDTVIIRDTYVGELVQLAGKVVAGRLVIDAASGSHVRTADPFLLDEIDQAVQATVQRALEILCVSLGLLLLSPLFLVIGLLLWLTTGQVLTQVLRFSRQAAAGEGEDRKAHRLLRFQTRRANGQLSGVGHYLERWELHRLPELLSVLSGELRLVGIKPLTAEEIDQANEPWHEACTGHDPGFTGLWYVQAGLEGELDEILVADVYYIATRSWGGDIRLLWQTAIGWCKRIVEEEKAYEPKKPRTTFG